MPSLSDFDTMVSGLTSQGVPREKAEDAARKRLGLPVDTGERDDRVREKEEQHEVTKLFRAYGFKVRSTSQARASKVAPGLPDLWVTHAQHNVAFWFETKRQVGGKLSPAQEEFRDDCAACGIGWYFGDRYVAARLLIALGVAKLADLPTSYQTRR